MNPPSTDAFTAGLEEDEPGIWHSGRTAVLSYPEEGNRQLAPIEDVSFWFRHRNRCIAALVSRYRPQGVLLDIGGGNGFVAQGLAAAGVRSLVVEPGPDGARAAAARGLAPVLR
nr:hypothetical protein [Gemmatimonadaceae bacterium]